MNPREKKSKVLRGIVPFNKLFFRSCYYHELISAYSKYGVSGDVILANYLPIIDFDETTHDLTVETIELFSQTELEQFSGLHLIRKKNSREIVREIVRSIDRGMPILVAVDCIELSYRADYYRKRHCGHYVLVYGYDLDRGVFQIVDHMYANSCRFEERETEIEAFERAHFGYIDHLNLYPAGIVKVKRVAGMAAIDVQEEFARKIKQNHVWMHKNATSLRNFTDYLEELFADEERLVSSLARVVDQSVSIRTMKSAQKYQLSAFMKDSVVTEQADKIVGCAIFVFGLIVKIQLTGRYHSGITEKIVSKLREWAELEETVARRMEELSDE